MEKADATAAKVKRMSVYKAMMRRRAFTKWVNLILRSIDKQIVDIFDANERGLLDRLYAIVLEKSLKKFTRLSTTQSLTLREAILNKARIFNENYYKLTQSQGHHMRDVNRPVVLQFIWNLIEYYHISPAKCLWQNDTANMNAKEVLLDWLNAKLGRKIRNFTTDWNDGIALCELVNALEPGLISAKVYLQGSWPRKNARVAIETAERCLGIPEILCPDDVTCSEVDELSVMTYVSLFFEYDLKNISTNQMKPSWTNDHAHNDPPKATATGNSNASKKGGKLENIDTDGGKIMENGSSTLPSPDQKEGGKALTQDDNLTRTSNTREQNGDDNLLTQANNGEVEKTPDIGKVGKVVEYILNFHDVKASEITVSVEYKPLEELTQDYKPDLKVFSLGKSRFRVKYTPNIAGFYRLSMFYQGEHIGDSPYCVKVLPGPKRRQNGHIDTNNNSKTSGSSSEDSLLSRTSTSESEEDSGGFYGFDGDGLRHAVVGKLALFTVITDNRDKGPLSVCINCPAVSIPVPHVTTTHSLNYSTHVIAYMPTLAGTYNIFVRWGLKLINGRPFQVEVRDHEVMRSRDLLNVKGTEAYNKKRQSTEFSHIKVYYSSTSLDLGVIEDTRRLEELFGRYGIMRDTYGDTWVSMDIELERDERELVFRLAGTKRLPLVFIHEKCLGGYEEVARLDKLDELEECLKYKIRKV